MIRFFGLDGEMSSADLEKGGRLIQIGVTAHSELDGSDTPGTEAFSAVLNPGPNEWAPIAEAVHGFTPADIARAEPAAEVDGRLVRWLVDHGADSSRRMNTIPVGFNVGAFDMPHVALVLPRSFKFFARRTVDLNAVMFTLEGALHDGEPVSANGWKALAIQYAERTIFAAAAAPETGAHDAGYDALLHLHAWRFLRSVAHGAPLPIPEIPAPAPLSKTWSLALIEAHGVNGAAEITGVPSTFLVQWSLGGRATNTVYLGALESAHSRLSV